MTRSLKQNQMLLCYSAANFVTIKTPKKVPIRLIEDYLAGNGAVAIDVLDYKLSNSLRTSLGASLVNQLLLNSLHGINNIKIIKKVAKARKQALANTTKWSYCKNIKPLAVLHQWRRTEFTHR
ncbi:MAG: hypothetical protein P3M75_00090 [Candidatus Hodgkinia cicadicola]|nr:MAG: hypothetical protein P3M75_00090 [Candidatus Hodgkinia cicadicola]